MHLNLKSQVAFYISSKSDGIKDMKIMPTLIYAHPHLSVSSYPVLVISIVTNMF